MLHDERRAVPPLDSGGPVHYQFEIDPSAIHAGILKAHEERSRAFIAMLTAFWRGLNAVFAWAWRKLPASRAQHPHDGHGGALAH